jgi:hypothetical protein
VADRHFRGTCPAGCDRVLQGIPDALVRPRVGDDAAHARRPAQQPFADDDRGDGGRLDADCGRGVDGRHAGHARRDRLPVDAPPVEDDGAGGDYRRVVIVGWSLPELLSQHCIGCGHCVDRHRGVCHRFYVQSEAGDVEEVICRGGTNTLPQIVHAPREIPGVYETLKVSTVDLRYVYWESLAYYDDG